MLHRIMELQEFGHAPVCQNRQEAIAHDYRLDSHRESRDLNASTRPQIFCFFTGNSK